MADLSVFYILRITFGLSVMIANLLALVILFKCKRMAFQIRILTIQLTITDAISGIFVTMMGLNISARFPAFCYLSYHTNVAVSYMTFFVITAVSGDRFLALCFPFQYRWMVSSRRVLYLTMALWTFSLGLSLLLLVWMNTTISKDCYNADSPNTIVGKEGFIQHASLCLLVILLNICFYIGIASNLFCRKDGLRTARVSGQRNYIKQQKRILTKILVIIGVFVITVLPVNIMMIIIALDYVNMESYTTAFFGTALLGMSNSILSPCVYVWRYPECRYKLMIYCTFWNTERQQTLEGRLNQYHATFDLQETPGTPASTSTSKVTAPVSASASTAVPNTMSQAIGTISATV